MKRRISLVVCMLILGAAMAFGVSSNALAAGYDEALARNSAETLFDAWDNLLTAGTFAISDEDRASLELEYGEEAGELLAVYDSWNELSGKLGAFKEIKDASFVEDKDIVSVTLTVAYENRDITFTVPVSTKTYELAITALTDIKVDLVKPFEQKMEEAGLNTLMGVGMVFVLLIFMSFVISLIKYVNRPSKPKEAPQAPKPAPAAPAAAPAVREVVESVDVTNDLEIVAVITAAIMAHMEASGMAVPEDGLVVRSIKRRAKNAW